MSKNYISTLGVFFLIAGSLASDNSTGISSTWKLDNDSGNYIDSSTTLWEKNECGLINCASLCGRDTSCVSFFHHSSLKKCLGSKSYKRGLPANEAMQQGWKYYTQPHHCDGDYVYNQTLGLCYKFYLIPRSYEDAMAYCERDGAKLLIINNTPGFQHFINMLLPEFTWPWIGLRGTDKTFPVFKWWNGQVAQNIPWFKGYPVLGDVSVVHLFRGKYLNKPFSTVTNSFLCQKLF